MLNLSIDYIFKVTAAVLRIMANVPILTLA